MNKLWAPWRIKYVTQAKTKGCIFCNFLKEKKDKNNFIVYRSKYSFVILNSFPYNNGHIMVVTNRHVASLENLTNEEILDVNKSLIKMTGILRKVLKPAGFNIGANLGKVSGAGIDKHLHFHLVPRWLGDTNFMPVLSNTKIICESLGDLYKKVKRYL